MRTKRRIGWLAVLAAVGATTGTVAAQSCPDCATSGSACGSRFSPRAWIQSRCAPKPATVCPGSCFGYFRTQWTAANQACPNWGTNCAEPPIGGMVQPVPLALPPVPANTIPPAVSGLAPVPTPNVVAPAPAATPAPAVTPPTPEQAPAPKASSDSKTFVPIPVLPPQPINTGSPLPPTPDLPRS